MLHSNGCFKVRRSAEPEHLSHFLKRDTRSFRNHHKNVRFSLASRSFVFRGLSYGMNNPWTWNSCQYSIFQKGSEKMMIDNVQQFLWSSSWWWLAEAFYLVLQKYLLLKGYFWMNNNNNHTFKTSKLDKRCIRQVWIIWPL